MPQNEMGFGAGLNQLLQRRLGVEGFPPAPMVASELFPTLCLESDRPEWHFLSGSRLCAGTIDNAAAGAGIFSFGGVVNPAGSGVIAVVTRVQTTEGANPSQNHELGIGLSSALGTTTVSGFFRDGRWGATRNPTCLLSQHTSASGLLNVGARIQQVSGYTNNELAYILTPGYSFGIRPVGANLLIRASFEWYERSVNPGELIGAVSP